MKKLLAILLILSCAALPSCTGGGTTTPTDTPPDTAAPTAPVIETETEPLTEEAVMEVYYVRTPDQPHEKTGITYPAYEFTSYDEAVDKADNSLLAASGYAVYSESGAFLWGVNNEYVTNMLYRAKYITDFAREKKYKYGNAAQNPAVTFHQYLLRGRIPTERVVSCDRLVGWVLYEMGYTDQPTPSGLFVWANAQNEQHNLMVFLENHNYERIDDPDDFLAGDIVFVRPTTSSGGTPYAAHVFLCAGSTGRRGIFYRYDHGSDTRIQSVQPSRETITELFCVYRPTQTAMADVEADMQGRGAD